MGTFEDVAEVAGVTEVLIEILALLNLPNDPNKAILLLQLENVARTPTPLTGLRLHRVLGL